MQIIGNQVTANKFYIINSFGSIEWVPNLDIAKKYVLDPRNKEWYNKTIYATNDDIVLDNAGRATLKTKVNKLNIEKKKIISENSIDIFKKQALLYNTTLINEFALKLGFESVSDAISWKDSSVKQKASEAKKVYGYREKVYMYFYTQLELFLKKSKNDIQENELLEACKNYIENFPMYK